MIDGGEISQDIHDFVARHLKSVADLEVLIFLFRHMDSKWTTEQLARELRTNATYSGSILKSLTATGIVEETEKNPGEYSLKTDDPERLRLIEKLLFLYETRRLSIINLIYQSPNEKIQTLADAFKIRK